MRIILTIYPLLLGVSISMVKGQEATKLTLAQVKYINQLNLKQFDDFTTVPLRIKNTKGLYFPPIQNGKVTIITRKEPTPIRTGKIPIDTLVLTFKDSLIVSAYGNNEYKNSKNSNTTSLEKEKNMAKTTFNIIQMEM